MKITEIVVYKITLPVPDGSYTISHGRSYDSFLSTIVAIKTDSEFTGIGECCPFGGAYAAAFPGGVAPGIEEIAPLLIGRDPRDLAEINALMDSNLVGHSYVKSPIDIACWDLLGKSAKAPIHSLIGGRLCDNFDVRMGIPVGKPEAALNYMNRLQRNGFRVFNAKAGDDPELDLIRIGALADHARPEDLIVVDANGGWRIDEAVYVMSALAKYPKLFFEQPCASYEECLAVRRRTNNRIIIDESLNSLQILLNARRDGVADAVTMKINKIGGLSKARLVRDVCVEIGMPLFIQDSWGSQITDATVSQLCQSTPPRFLLGGWCTWGQVAIDVVSGPSLIENGRMSASKTAGLGIEVRSEILGKPFAMYS